MLPQNMRISGTLSPVRFDGKSGDFQRFSEAVSLQSRLRGGHVANTNLDSRRRRPENRFGNVARECGRQWTAAV